MDSSHQTRFAPGRIPETDNNGNFCKKLPLPAAIILYVLKSGLVSIKRGPDMDVQRECCQIDLRTFGESLLV